MKQVNIKTIDCEQYDKLDEILNNTLRDTDQDYSVSDLYEDDTYYYKPVFGKYISQIEEGHGMHDCGYYEVTGYEILINKKYLWQ